MTEFVMHDTTAILREIVRLPKEQRGQVIREKIIAPFQGMFAAMRPRTGDQNLAAGTDADIEMARGWMMLPPDDGGADYLAALDRLENAQVSAAALHALERAEAAFAQAGIDTRLDRVQAGVFPLPPGNPQIAASRGYTGFGGIAGYIVMMLWPDEYTLPRLPAATVHELNHQVRFNYYPMGWNVSVREYLVAEGLAESFAGSLYGSELIGPWVSEHSPESLARSKEIIGKALDVRGFNAVRGYIFGDASARQLNLPVTGLPDFAGYVVGYHLVQAFLHLTGRSAVEATILPAEEIVAEAGYF